VHTSSLDYWRPDNRNASVPTLSFSDQMYSWAGGTSMNAWGTSVNSYTGYDLALPGYTWRRSDYLTIKEMSLSYRFNGPGVRRVLGVDNISVGVTCNNLYTFTDIVDVDPQRQTTAISYYPTMRVVKFNVNLSF